MVNKFRAWNKIVKRYQYFTLEELPGMENIQWHILEIEQCSGKQDKTGKDVYEGDIFRLEVETDEGDKTYFYIATWIQEWTMFASLDVGEYVDYITEGIDRLDKTMYWTFPLENSTDFTVVGNIKEHPHKIKGHVFFEGV